MTLDILQCAQRQRYVNANGRFQYHSSATVFSTDFFVFCVARKLETAYAVSSLFNSASNYLIVQFSTRIPRY